MFDFVGGQAMPMLAFLEQYLDRPQWCHATDVVPMVAMTPPEAWPLWDSDAIEDEVVQSHLIDSLNYWSAFRRPNTAVVADCYGAFSQNLTQFIMDIQALPGARLRLSEIPEAEIRGFAHQLTRRLLDFGLKVKGVHSCVLPSKTAHFFLLGLVPAYDQRVIRHTVLPRLARNCWDMQSYVVMSWWVLQQFVREGTLGQACAAVARYMMEEQMGWTYALPQPAPNHWLLQSMDSVVAEYTLIQMARNADHHHVLRRVARVRH
jgi:hypothetical protein